MSHAGIGCYPSRFCGEVVSRRVKNGVDVFTIKPSLGDEFDVIKVSESAKAVVTDEMVERAVDARIEIISRKGRINVSDNAAMRCALEAVAPMLASIQSPDMVCEQHPWSEWPHDDCAGPGMPGTAQYEALVYLAKLASAWLPDEKEDLDPVRLRREGRVATEWERGFNEGWNDCRDAMLAAAPKPEKELEMKWYPFDKLKGSLQKRPPERRLVLVQTAGGPDNMGIVYPPSIAVGYRKDAAGDKQCPYFVVPGIGERNGEIVGWCDCLGDDFQVSMSLRGRFWFTPYPNKERP